MAKSGTEDRQLKVFDHIKKPAVGSKLLTSLAERYQDRAGGYTRVWSGGLRLSDRAPIAVIELVDGPFDMKKYFQGKLAAASGGAGPK